MLFATVALRLAFAAPTMPDVPSYVPEEFDCAMREYALKFAKAKELGPPKSSLQDVADALQVGTGLRCPADLDALLDLDLDSTVTAAAAAAAAASSCSKCVYVDPAAGRDTHAGTISAPVRTVAKGVALARDRGTGSTVYLRGGTHWLHGNGGTIALGTADSGLTLAGFPGEVAVVSGGVALDTPAGAWKRAAKVGVAVPAATANIWYADISAAKLNDMPGLRIGASGERVVRARHPNGDPERMGRHTDPSGWVEDAMEWLPGIAAGEPKTPPIEVMVTTPSRAEAYAVYPYFTNGLGGRCNGLFTPNASFWCNPRNPRDGVSGQWNGTGGLVYNSTVAMPTATWTDRAVVQLWSGSHWASQMFYVDSHEPASTSAAGGGGGGTIKYTNGGFQDARAFRSGAEWYVENVHEFVDAPNEYFYEPKLGHLYLYHNGTGPPNATLVATQLQTLLSITGTLAKPVRGVVVKDIQFRDAAQTFLEPHGVPSCGDWALQRMAGVFIEGTESTTVDGCGFTRMDGNGLMLSRYNRNATVSHSEFAFIGDTAMAAWGYTDEFADNGTKGFDGTPGEFPRYTSIVGNIVREVGLWEKQSSAWFQAKSMQTTIKGNLFFNGPRAGINFNDGFGGGNVIDSNLVFNMCRESSDHGPFNSWDRNMYLVHQPDDHGPPSNIKQYDTISNNMMIANYGSQEAIDNDDGSGFFHTHHNFLVYGHYGEKTDMAGHDNFHVNNLYAYLYPVCYVDLGGGEAMPAHKDGYHNNTCIQGLDGGTYAAIDCKDNASRPEFSGNQVYNPSGKTEVCGFPLAQWQAMGNDPGTRVHRGIPDPSTILAMADVTLGIVHNSPSLDE